MTAWPATAKDLLRRAAALRSAGEHVGAGMLEKDAAAIIRGAEEAEHLRLLRETDPDAWGRERRRIAARNGWV